MKRMKKILPLLLGLVLMAVAFTGCGKTAAEVETEAQATIRENDLKSVEQFTEANFVQLLTQLTAADLEGYMNMGQALFNPTFSNDFLSRWKFFEEEHGQVVYAEVIETQAESSLEGFDCRILLQGLNDAEPSMTLSITYDEQVNPIKTVLTEYSDDSTQTLGSKMTAAAGNIVVGLLVVFMMLIILCLIITSFKFIGGVGAPKKVAKPVEEKKEAVQAPVAAPVVKKEEDNKELIAVIAAAIAAAEGTSPSGFVVRSIRRLDSNKWR
ncbi:MAG: OadG family protein [Lachnospiraceae bacterium]|nr:OadG family protein [Lachnospiraceae bacterium]